MQRSWTQLPGLKHAVFLAITYVVVKFMVSTSASVSGYSNIWKVWTKPNMLLSVQSCFLVLAWLQDVDDIRSHLHVGVFRETFRKVS